MTLTIEQKIAVLYPVACCISFESLSSALRAKQVTVDDIHRAVGLKRPGNLAAQSEVLRHCEALARRAVSLARLVQVTSIGDLEGEFDTEEELQHLAEAVKVAREVLA